MTFILEQAGLELSISEDHIATMVSYIAASKVYETGGILIGYYTDDQKCAVISQIVGPPQDSRSGTTWFKRGVRGLSKLFKRAWEKKEYYLGEWHFHPLGTTSPSGQDLKQMREIAQDRMYQCPEAIMIIIAGSAKNYMLKPFLTISKTGITTPMTRKD